MTRIRIFGRENLKLVLAIAVCLVVGWTGPSIAHAAGLITSAKIKDNTIQSRDIRNGQVKAADIGVGQVRSPDIATGQVTGSDVAERSLNLRGNCSEGMVKGNVVIQGSHGAAIPTFYTSQHRAFAYNCTGGDVLVKRDTFGAYSVKFVNSPFRGAVATIDVVNATTASHVVVRDIGPGEFEVFVRNPSSTFVDADVEVLLW
jgi:hypothetical protein